MGLCCWFNKKLHTLWFRSMTGKVLIWRSYQQWFRRMLSVTILWCLLEYTSSSLASVSASIFVLNLKLSAHFMALFTQNFIILSITFLDRHVGSGKYKFFGGLWFDILWLDYHRSSFEDMMFIRIIYSNWFLITLHIFFFIYLPMVLYGWSYDDSLTVH